MTFTEMIYDLLTGKSNVGEYTDCNIISRDDKTMRINSIMGFEKSRDGQSANGDGLMGFE
jgi:hypothetical protein